jgi:perosamine synthetase
MPEPLRVPSRQVVFSAEERRRIVADIDRVLESGWLTLGPEGEQLEQEFASRTGLPHVIATASGTSAIEICLRVMGVAGREVIVPANTFFATAGAVVHAGGTPVFCDVHPATLMPALEDVQAAWTPDTAGVVLVHIGGAICAEIGAIAAWATGRGIWLLEDAAHAAGSSLDGRAPGHFGVAATYSLYPTKVITAGEGGLIATRDASLAAEARVYRDQGKTSFSRNEHVRMGSNWRLSEVHAVIGRSQLRQIDEFISARRAVADAYDRSLGALRRWELPTSLFCNFYKYCAFLPPGVDRQTVKRELREHAGLSLAGEVYDTPLHRQPVFSGRPYSLPGADEACARHVALPMSAAMTPEQAIAVVRAVNALPALRR